MNHVTYVFDGSASMMGDNIGYARDLGFKLWEAADQIQVFQYGGPQQIKALNTKRDLGEFMWAGGTDWQYAIEQTMPLVPEGGTYVFLTDGQQRVDAQFLRRLKSVVKRKNIRFSMVKLSWAGETELDFHNVFNTSKIGKPAAWSISVRDMAELVMPYKPHETTNHGTPRYLISSGYVFGREAERLIERERIDKMRERLIEEAQARNVLTERMMRSSLPITAEGAFVKMMKTPLHQTQPSELFGPEPGESMSCTSQKSVFEYVVVLRVEDTDGNDASEIIVGPTVVLAANADVVKMIATKEIPEANSDDLEFCEVVVRPFRGAL